MSDKLNAENGGGVGSSVLLADLKRQLKASETESDALGAKMSVLQEQQHKLKLAIAETKYGVKLGVTVTGRDSKKFRVTKVDVRWDDRPWLEGNPLKKDGSWGTAIRNLYDNWTVESAKDALSEGAGK